MFFEEKNNLVLILDALDECEDNSLFLPRLLDLATRENITLLLTSRRQKRLVRYLEHVDTLEIAPGDVHQDIESFVTFKVARNVRLSHALVRDIVVQSLLDQHHGMFLWVTLMLKELKACISVEEVHMTLMHIPSGLEGLYSNIVNRLERSLTRRAAEVTKNILTWVLGSARVQYQAQGHTLLSDGDFPYTDKDIESMCGSLISIRHGQIQTVHQSTKDHLVGLAEVRRLGQDLSILPTSVDTSLHLASVCLTYQEKFCKSTLVKLQMTPFEHRPKGFDIRMLQANGKLLEYSFFFWIHHVLGCPTNNRESVVAIILRHFSNFMTVSWVVVSMLLDVRGLWRFLIGIEELEEWLHQGNPEGKLDGAKKLLHDWCSGIARLLKAYNTLLLDNPWGVWRLDLRTFLGLEQSSAASINYFHESNKSEENLQSCTDQAAQSQTIPQNATLGHNEWSLMKATLGFFVYDQNQNIFLSGEKETSEEGECLFVQHARSGKRLSPATAGLATVLADQKKYGGYVITAKISEQGKYLAVIYNKWLSIWAIQSGIKFSNRLRDRAWAFRLISEKYQKGELQHMTDGNIAFAGDDRLLMPSGWWDLSTKKFLGFQSVLSNQLGAAHAIHYSGDGKCIFSKDSMSSEETFRRPISQVGVVDTITTTFKLDCTRIIKSSNTGKYLLLHNSQDGNGFSLTLFSVVSMEMKNLPDLQEFSSFGYCSFHFPKGDETLVTFLWQAYTRRGVHAQMTVMVWELGSGQPKLCNQGQISTVVAAPPQTINNLPIIALTARDLAWIVSCDRTVQVVKFNTEEVCFPGYQPPEIDESPLYSQVSQDAHRLGNLRIMGSKIMLEVISLLPSLQEDFKLEKVVPGIERVRPICLSPNLDLLVVGKFAFTIHIEAKELLLLTEFDIDLVTPVRDCDWACTISSCGEFVAFDKPAYKHFLDCEDRQLGRCVIFRINRTERTATRLMIPCPKHVQAASPDFHPLIPLAAFSTSEGEGSENHHTDSRRPQGPANELSLSMIHLNEDRLVPMEPLQMTRRICPKLHVAETGDFLVLEDRYMESRIIVSDLPYQSQPLCVIPEDRYIHASKDRSYMLECRYGSIMITMYKYQGLVKDTVLPTSQALESTAKVKSLTVFPSTMGRPKAWLLLGVDYAKPLRVLLNPTNGESIVVKTLMVSWNQLKERLETTFTPVRSD